MTYADHIFASIISNSNKNWKFKIKFPPTAVWGDTGRGVIVSILKFIYSDLENKIIDHKPILYLNYTLISLDTMINTHKNGFIFAKTQPSKVCWCVDCKNREKKIEFQFKQILNRWYNNRLSPLMIDTWHGDLTGAVPPATAGDLLFTL